MQDIHFMNHIHIYIMYELIQAPIFTSFYIVHLLEWLKVFPRDQLLVFRHEDYISDIRATMKQICSFLDVGRWLNNLISVSH